MNKKCMSKVGAVSVMLALALSLITISLLLLASATTDQYFSGEKIKIDIGDIGEYSMVITTPTQTLIQKSDKPYFIYQPIQIGDYEIKIESDETKKTIEFKIISESEIPEEDNTTQVSTEETEQVVKAESSLEITTTNQPRVGIPVQWEKEITVGENIQVKIPESSTDIQVQSNNKSIDFKIKTSITDTLSNIVSSENQKTIAISQSSPNTTINYVTPAPIKKEKTISKTMKEVEISADLHYENVLAYTTLPEELVKDKESSINVYWKEEKEFLPFKAFDTNNNSLLDKIEWTVPHLSTQTFEIIIITRAEHLDENRMFIKDVYDNVKERDNIWQLIPMNNFVRVVFEKELTSRNDITLYAKSNSTNATVEVYEKDGTEKLATFPIINQDKKYQILLTSLPSPQNTFDLLVVGAGILFDLIIDPSDQTNCVGPNCIEIFNTTGSTTWQAPAGVTQVSVVAVGAGGGSSYDSRGDGGAGGGGGGLGWENNIAVTSGNTYDVVVGSGGTRDTNTGATSTATPGGDSYFINIGTVFGGGGGAGAASGGAGGSYSGTGGGSGGNGGTGSTADAGGGGGAGGYSGNGGAGGNSDSAGSAGTGGAGGGGGAGGNNDAAGGGGGVGLTGEGASGTGGTYDGGNGGGGAGGSSGAAGIDGDAPQGDGGLYGGGGGGAENTNNEHGNGASGAVAISYEINVAPTISETILESYFQTNMTTENLTCNAQATDLNNDSINLIYNWIESGASIFQTIAPFEVGSTDILTPEYSGNLGYDLIASATYNQTAGYDGFGAYSFDGATEYISLDNAAGSSTVYDAAVTQRTVFLRYYADAVSGATYRVLFEEGGGVNGLDIYIYNGNIYAGAWSEGTGWNGAWASTATTANTWHTAALVFDGTSSLVSLYHDGNFISVAGSTQVAAHTGDDYLGYTDGTVASPNSGTDIPAGAYFDGIIDDFMVLDIALSEEQLDSMTTSGMKYLMPEETSVGDTYTCEVTPNDGGVEGSTSTSNSLTVLVYTVPRTIGLDVLSPLGNYDVYQNEFFNITVNLTCLTGACGTVNVTMDPVQNFLEDFEAYSIADTTFNLNWTNVVTDDCSWHADNDGTASGGTGPAVDHTRGDAAGMYAYMEASASAPAPITDTCGTTGEEAHLESYDLDADAGEYNVSFWYHMYGGDMGSLHLDVFDGSWQNSVWSASGDLGDTWFFQNIDLSSYTGTIKLRFRGVRGSNWASDMALDDITIIETTQDAKGVIPMNSGSPFYTTTQNPFTSTSLSAGQSQEITYEINATGELNATYEFFSYANLTDAAFISAITPKWNVTIKERYIAPPSIGLEVLWPISSDVFVEKDQLFNVTLNVTCLAGNCGSINVTLDPIQETFNDFETGTEGFEHFPLNAKEDQWHISTEEANDGTQSWKCGDTGTAAYASYSDAILVTPTYEMIANSTFSFHHYMFTESGYDGGYMEYRLDEGSWNIVTDFITGGYTGTYREYNGGPPLTEGDPIWTSTVGSDTSFQRVELDMSAITGENISFRFHFFSDASVTREGWYVDSVNFTTQTPSMDKGIIPTGSGTPFYTTAATNPLTTNPLSENQSQTITFFVNATGELNSKYFFFAYANMTSDLSISDITPTWNVTISVDQELPNITINYPTSGDIQDATPILDIDLTSDADELWYNINGGANKTLCSACSISTDEVLYLREASYTVNVFVKNPMGEENSKSVSFDVDMKNNYYDSFLDSSHELSSENVELLPGNITLSLVGEDIIDETFTDVENWLLYGGQWQLISGEIVQSQNSADTLAIYDTLELNNITDYNISFDMYAADNDQSGIVFAYEDPDNYFRCRLYEQTNQGGIEQISAGVSSSLATATTMYNTNQWNTFLLEIKNKTVSCYINGALTATASDVSFPEGKVGIFNSENLNMRYDNFQATVTGGQKIGTFTGYTVKLINAITKFTNITWNSFSDNINNFLKVELTVDNGDTWYEATKDSSLTIPSGSDFAYRVFFATQDISQMSLLDLNITWINSIEPPPAILIEGITLPIEQDYTPMVNVTLVGDAAALTMSINGAANQTICTDCTGSQIFPVVLDEAMQTIRFYANNSMGQLSSNTTTFEVDFNKHYYDDFLDNSSVRESNNVIWNYANMTMTGGTGNFTSHTMNTSQEITRISYASWTESGVDAGNTISLQLTVDNGNTWYPIANGASLSGFTAGSNLIYRFLYVTDGPNTITAHDLNITWESPPTIQIHYPETYIYNSQITKMNYSISHAAGVSLVACWYSLNGGASNTSMTCGDDITGITSADGSNTWTVYAMDSAGSQGQKSITFSVDTSAPVVTLINQTNQAGQIVNSGNPLFEGENLTLNMDIDDSQTDSVWVVIWEGVIGGVEKAKVLLENVFGNWWSTEVETDETFGESYNYTVYANDTAGLVGSYNGTFSVLKATISLLLNPNPNAGGEPVFMTGLLQFSNTTLIPNNAINFWLDNVLIPFENITNQGSSANVLNFDENDIAVFSSYDNVTYSGGEFTLDSLNTTGAFTGILDAGARVNWQNVSWTDVAQACSGTVDFQDGNAWGYGGTKDSYITSGSPTLNFGSSTELTLDTSPDVEKSIVEFDRAFGFGANKVPYASTITAATLRLTLFDSGDNPTFYEILEAWDEDDVTSIYRTSDDLWSAEAVSGSPSRGTSSIGTMTTTTVGTKSLDILSTASRWAARTIPNNGLIIDPSGSGGIKFRSSEYATQNERPRLTVDFTATDCNGVLVYVRTSNDKSSWTDWRELANGQSIADELNYSRYLEYRVEMGSFTSTQNPRLLDLDFNYTGTFTDTNGLFNYSFITTDVFGSYGAKVTSGFKTIKAESSATLNIQSGVPPEVNLLAPSNETWTDMSSINLTYNATDVNGDFKSALLILNGAANQTNQTTITSGANNFTLSGLASGIYTWSVNLSDIASTTSSETWEFYLDTIEPVVNLIHPANDTNFTAGFLNLSFEAYDNMDSELTCEVTLDGSIIHSGIAVTNNTIVNVSSGPLSGMLHSWSVTCSDEVTNEFTSPTWEFLITDIPPTVALVSPEDNHINSTGTIDFTYFPDDNSGMDRCELLLDGEINSTSSSINLGENNVFNIPGIADGIYNWTVRCFDLSNTSVMPSNRTLSVDLLPPTIQLISPANESDSTTSQVDFQFNATDTIDSELDCSLFIDGINEASFQSTSGAISTESFSGLNDGLINWRVDCTDNSSHTASSPTWTLNISEAPRVSMNSTNSTYTTGNAIIAEFTPTDNTQIASCSFYLDGILNTTQVGGIAMGSINSMEVENVEDGRHTYYIQCSDGIGLSNVSGENEIFIDNSKPQITPHFPLNEEVYSSNVSFKFEVFDPLSPTLICNLTVDSSIVDSGITAANSTNITREISGITDGTHHWNLTCLDLAGNANTSTTYNFTKSTVPGISLVSPLNDTRTNASDFNFTYFPQDDEGFEKSELIINGAVYMQNQTTITTAVNNNFTVNLADGTYIWSVNVTDSTGLIGESEERTVYVDTSAPVLNLASPLEGQTISSNNVTFAFNATDNLDSIMSCDLYIGSDLEWSGNATNASNEAVSLLLIDGNYTYTINCSDNAANEVISTETNFTVFAPPRINLISPPNKTYTADSELNFSYTPLDAIGLDNCSIFLDETREQTSSSIIKNTQNNFTISGISEGVHNWYVECSDMDSNLNTSETRTFTRDITPPQIELTSPENNVGVDANSDAIFVWTTTDALDALLTCDLIVDGNNEDTSFATSGFPRTEPVSGLSIGIHSWNVTCTDQSGNSNTSETRTFDYTYPDFQINETLISISNNNPTEEEVITINATIHNLGNSDAPLVEVKFYNGDPEDSGTQIGATQTISIPGLSSNTTSITWDAPLGSSNIFVVVDYPNTITELLETNNKANKSISVQSWHFFYGNLNSGETNFTLTDSSDYELTNWNLENLTQANIYVADYDSSITWNSLQAIGKKESGTASTNDIQEIDTALVMTAFKDSHETLYLNASLGINETLDYTIFAKQIASVPVTTSILSSNFKTGILWDTSDDIDSDSEYDTADKEDIVYVTKVNKNSPGSYETADYELRVPATLREYDPANQQTAVFYIEII